MAKLKAEKEKAVRVVSHYSDFDEEVWTRGFDKSTAWKLAFYEMWRLQMTWGFAYEIEVMDSRKNGAFIDILAKEAFADNVKGSMEDLGFGGITTHEEYVMLVDDMDFDDYTYSVSIR